MPKTAESSLCYTKLRFNHDLSIDSTYADANGGAGSKSWYFKELGRTVQVYNSNYADFANAVVPKYKVDVTGIMKRYNNSWELIIRTLDDVKKAATAIYEEGFATGTGEWTAVDVTLPEGLKYVWGGSAYGAKASAYVGGANHAAESWLVSPEIDLTAASNATLAISQAANFIGSTFGENCKILVSTDYKTGAPSTAKWTELTLDNVPTAETKWNMVDGTTSLSKFAARKYTWPSSMSAPNRPLRLGKSAVSQSNKAKKEFYLRSHQRTENLKKYN